MKHKTLLKILVLTAFAGAAHAAPQNEELLSLSIEVKRHAHNFVREAGSAQSFDVQANNITRIYELFGPMAPVLGPMYQPVLNIHNGGGSLEASCRQALNKAVLVGNPESGVEPCLKKLENFAVSAGLNVDSVYHENLRKKARILAVREHI